MEKIEQLVDFLNNQGEQAEAYLEHPDNINNYVEVFEGHDLYFGEIEESIRDKVEKFISKLSPSEVLDLCTPQLTYGIHAVSNEIWSIWIGEVAHQINIPSEFSDLSSEEIQQAIDACDYVVNDDFLYVNASQYRVSLILDIDKVLDLIS